MAKSKQLPAVGGRILKRTLADFERACYWWQSEGVYIDPDTGEVDWFDKRAELAKIAWLAGYKAAKDRP